jgi:VanZ family protein
LLPLRHPKLWLLLGWLMVIGVVTASLVPSNVVEAVLGDLSDKLEHAAAYGALMLWFGGMSRRSLQLPIAVALVALGGIVELLQGLTPTRMPDLTDLVADAGGVLLGLVLTMTVLAAWCQRIERLFPVR